MDCLAVVNKTVSLSGGAPSAVTHCWEGRGDFMVSSCSSPPKRCQVSFDKERNIKKLIVTAESHKRFKGNCISISLYLLLYRTAW